MLGDAVATTVDCDNGQASVLQMDTVFQSLPANLQANFQTAHDTLMQSYNNTWYTGIDWIPFNTACGTMQQIGLQADQLTQQMQAAAGNTGLTAGPSTQGQGMSLTTILFMIGVGYLGLVYLAGHHG